MAQTRRKRRTKHRGNAAGIGGTVSVPVHLDCLILEPTLEIAGDRVLERGHLLL